MIELTFLRKADHPQPHRCQIPSGLPGAAGAAPGGLRAKPSHIPCACPSGLGREQQQKTSFGMIDEIGNGICMAEQTAGRNGVADIADRETNDFGRETSHRTQ